MLKTISLLFSLTIVLVISGCVSQEIKLINETFDKMAEKLEVKDYIVSFPTRRDYPSLPQYISAVGEARFNLIGNKSGNEFILYATVAVCNRGSEDYCIDKYKEYILQG